MHQTCVQVKLNGKYMLKHISYHSSVKFYEKSFPKLS